MVVRVASAALAAGRHLAVKACVAFMLAAVWRGSLVWHQSGGTSRAAPLSTTESKAWLSSQNVDAKLAKVGRAMPQALKNTLYFY